MADEAPAWTSRKLLRAARAGSLGTTMEGQPFVSLVTPATAPDFSVLLFLSALSEHTRHLRADARCSLMVMGAPTGENPQTAPRLTVTGVAEAVEDAGLKARWLAMHPYAEMYAGFADFSLWRVRPIAGLLVAGFARAHRLRQAELAPDAGAVAALEASADGIMTHCNNDHADALAAIAGGGGAWRMVAVDVDGCDLASGEVVRRVHWGAPVADAGGVRGELVRMARGQ